MKKLLLLSLVLLLAIPQISKASHVLGGEITWQCLPNGSYVFYAKVYRDCTGIGYPFDNKTLEIVGNPLPRNAVGGTTISSILLKPDSNAFIANNFGDISPKPVGPNSQSAANISCANADAGAVQEFPFQSDPVQLFGTPPAAGWKFYLVQPCCRPNITNLAAGGTMMLRAAMYADSSSNQAGGQCNDNSPQFYASPQYTFCRGVNSSKQFSAYDLEQDSLVFDYDRTYNSPAAAPQAVPYAAGYSFNNPTPDASFDVRNVACLLTTTSGLINFAVYSDTLVKDYLVVNRVDAYRNGQLIASVYRELPVVLFDCQSLPNNALNQKPEIKIGGASNAIQLDVVAGETVTLPIDVSDLDSNATGLQAIRLTTNSINYAADYSTPTNCGNPPCATFLNNQPQYDSSRQVYAFDNVGSLTTTFNWQTACNHLGPNDEMKTYRFYFKAEDEAFPIPQKENAYILINVHPKEMNPATGLCGDESGNDLALSWDGSAVDSASFVSWRVYKRIGTANYQLVDTVANYQTTAYLDQSFQSTTTAEYKIVPLNSICGKAIEGASSQLYSSSYLSPVQVNRVGLNLSTVQQGAYQWYNCNTQQIVPGATSASFTANDSGDFALILKRGECIDTSSCVAVFGVGLDEASLQEELSVYPNPSNGKVFVDSEGNTTYSYRVFSIKGKLMNSGSVSKLKNTIDLPKENGLYIVEIQDIEGQRAHFRMIKH